MLNIAIDLGSYSIKFIHFNIEKKQVIAKTTHEIILEIQEGEQLEEHDLWTNQIKEVRNYLNEIEVEYQIIMNMTSEIISTRFLSVPGKNKKRATMMVPFLIEEDLPFPITSCHFAETIDVKDNNCDILAGVIKKDHFQDFYNILNEYEVEPKILTNDVAIFESYMKSNFMNFSDSFCILEVGHEATRGYFFHKGKLVANHHSFIAGKVITEDISKTYNISQEEATIYKHQNAFVLTDGQFDHVNENQKDFAKLMESTLHPLISEIRRWEIGFRVKHGVAISEYHICGGTTNINNFNNFLSVKLGVKVNSYNPFLSCKDDQIDKDPKFRNKFTQACTLMQGMKYKSRFINFLKGEFSFQGNEVLPLESIAFLGVRVMIVTFLLLTYMISSGVSTSSKNKLATKEISKTLKRGGPIFNISARDKKERQVNAAPLKILNKLKKQDRMIQQEIKTIQSAVKTNALNSLQEVVALISTIGSDVEILKFHSLSGEDFKMEVTSKEVKDLEKIKRSFKESTNYKFFTELNEQSKILTIDGEEK